jgi:hypothetical protein
MSKEKSVLCIFSHVLGLLSKEIGVMLKPLSLSDTTIQFRVVISELVSTVIYSRGKYFSQLQLKIRNLWKKNGETLGLLKEIRS